MILELVGAPLVTYPIHWLPLQALVYEVCGTFVPSIWNVVLFDLYLSEENLIPNILSCTSLVRSLTHHALISNDSHGEVVRSKAVVLSAHNFRSHITRRATGLTSVIG